VALAPCAVLAAMLALATALAAQQPRPAGHRLVPGDRISVQVDELAEINGNVLVADDGTITLERIGSVAVRDQTLAQTQERIRERLAAMGVREPTVRLTLIEHGSRPVSVLGAVNNPGNEPIRGSERLFDVLMRRGGVSAEHGTEIRINRVAENGLHDQLVIPVDALVERADPVLNIPIIPGDRIQVPAARKITYFIIGEVALAGPVTVSDREHETLLTAIARSGGLSDNASNKIEIVRRAGGDGTPRSIFAHYGRLLSGREPDVPIEDGDIIKVKESFF